MKPLAWNHSERGIYDCSRGPPPPYAASKSIMDESAVASRALVHPTPSHTTTSTKPGTVTFQTFNQMVGTVQPIAQAQAYKPQQVHSNNESCSQNIFVYKTISQPMCQTIYAPGTKPVTLQNKGGALSNNPAEPIALNGVVWMTAAGQMAHTVNSVYGVQFARMMQSHNPMHQNVKQSSKTPASISPAAGGAPQGQLNLSDSQGNHSSAQNLTAKDNSRCSDQTQIQSAFRKEDIFQDQSKTHSTLVGTTPARVLYRIWPIPPSYASAPQQIYGDRVKGDSSERAGSSVNLSQQQSGQHDVTNSNGQKRMMLARVTPMSQDWRNLQQNTNTFSTTDINKPKNLQLEDAMLHHKLGNNQESRTVSAFEQLFEMKNTTIPQLSAVRTSAQRDGSNASLVPPLLHKPSLHTQQNIHFIYTPATVSEQHTVTSSMSSLKAQHNATGPGNYISISNTNSKDPVASQLPPLSAGQGTFGVSSSSLNLFSQQTMTVSSVGAGSLCNNDHQNVLLPSVVPHSTNMSCSTFRLESKEGGKHPVHIAPSSFSLTPVRFSQENSQSSSVQLSTTDDCGKQSATSLPLVPPSMVEHNCQIMEGNAVYAAPSTSASEKDIPAKVIGGQVDTSDTVVETSFSMLETSKYSATSAANLSGSSGQYCQEMLVHGSSTIGERSEQQKKCANSMPVLIKQPSPRDLSSSFELNGNKRNLTSDTEIYISHTHPTLCEVQENLAVNNSPPPKRFLASALEDASQDGHSYKNTILCPDKESINSPELLHNEGLDKSGATNMAEDEAGVQPDICITGVFSLGDDTGLWESVQQENLTDHINPDASSSVITSDKVHNSPGSKGLITVESGMRGKTNQAKECNTTVVNEQGPVMCVPLSNLESSQCHSVTESPRMVHTQPVMERWLDKNIGQMSDDSNDPANVLVDLTTADYCSSDPVLPCTFKEHETKLVSDKSCLPFEVDDQHPLPFDKETQDLDELLHSVEAAIETLVNFWNPEYTQCTCGNTGKSTCKHNNLQGQTSESKLPTEKADLSVCGAVQVPEKADLLKGPGCDLSTDVKVLGHVEILNLLAEISSSNQRLPAESAESEQFTHSTVRLNKEVQQKASQNVSGDESNEYGVKVLERKGRGYKGEPNCAPLQGLHNNNSTVQKGKQQEKKVYCCINAWLIASGVLGINCNCKSSQGSKPGSQTDLPTAVHKSQSSSEMSSQNGFANQMEIEPTLNNVPFVTHKNVLEISEMRNSTPGLVPNYHQEKPLGEVPQEVCSADAVQQTSEVRAMENETEDLWNTGNANLSGFNASDTLTHVVGLEENEQKKIEERKEVSFENGPIKEGHTVLEKETGEDKTKNVRRDSSLNVLNKKASDQSDVLQFKQHIVKLGFKVMKRKADSTSCRSPQSKRKNGVQGKKIFVRSLDPKKSNHKTKTKCHFQGSHKTKKPTGTHFLKRPTNTLCQKKFTSNKNAKVLPKYNCRIMIQDKTYSSSGENAVLVSLVPLSGNPYKAKEKVDVKN